MPTYIWILSILLIACTGQKKSSTATETPTNQSGVDIPASAQSIAFELIQEGQYCGYQESGNYLISDDKAWNDLWAKVASNQVPPPPAPKVNFASHLVIACFMGPQTSGGHSLKISSVQTAASTAYVSITHRKPGINCFVTDAITQPYSIVQIPKGKISETSFITKEDINEC